MKELTIFENLYDRNTDKKLGFENFNALETAFENISKNKIDKKTDSHLVSPAVFLPNTTRANKNVVKWTGWCCVDVDNMGADEFQNLDFGFRCFVYSTASSKKDAPKFRVVIDLDRDVDVAEIPHFWFALNKELHGVVDKQTKDASRMFYLPANYSGAFNFFIKFNGQPIVVNELLSKYRYEVISSASTSVYDRLPQPLKNSIMRKKIGGMQKTYSWSSYRDCPFVSKKIVRDYASIAHVDGTGRYHQIYSIMVSIASKAFKMGYPITENELVLLIKQIDADTSRKYQKRKLDVEAKNAIMFALRG